MANFQEQSQFNGVRIIEVTDDVKGGADGAVNVSLQSLVNRTKFLNNALADKADAASLSTLATKAEVQAKADKTELTALATKTELNSKADKTELSTLATKTEVENKADKSSTLAGYGITNGVVNTITVSAGVGLTGGGALSANRSIAADIATAANVTSGTANKLIDAARLKVVTDGQNEVIDGLNTTIGNLNATISNQNQTISDLVSRIEALEAGGGGQAMRARGLGVTPLATTTLGTGEQIGEEPADEVESKKESKKG